MSKMSEEGCVHIACPKCNYRTTTTASNRVSCSRCGHIYKVDDGITVRVSESEIIRELAKRGAVEYDRRGLAEGHKFVIRKLKPPTKAGISKGEKRYPGFNDARVVLYLPGDERRAATKFVRQNQEFVRSCIEDESSNPLSLALDDFMWELIKEQYHWLGYSER